MGPLAIRGSAAMSDASMAGVAVQTLELEGSLGDGRFQANAALRPLQGSIRLKARGDLGGWMHSGIEAEGLDVTWLTLLARQLRGSDPEPVRDRSLSCLLYTSPSPRDVEEARMPSSA